MYSQMEDRDNLTRIRAVTLDRNSMLLQRRSDSPRDHATGERKYNQRRSKLEDSDEEAQAIYPMVRSCLVVVLCVRGERARRCVSIRERFYSKASLGLVRYGIGVVHRLVPRSLARFQQALRNWGRRILGPALTLRFQPRQQRDQATLGSFLSQQS